MNRKKYNEHDTHSKYKNIPPYDEKHVQTMKTIPSRFLYLSSSPVELTLFVVKTGKRRLSSSHDTKSYLLTSIVEYENLLCLFLKSFVKQKLGRDSTS